MQRNKRLRVFAGPNGSGKSTLYKAVAQNYNTGYFINADELEAKLSRSGLIDISEIGLEVTAKDLSAFKKKKEAKSLLSKSKKENRPIDVKIDHNFIVDRSKNVHSYEAAFVAAFLRQILLDKNRSFSFETVMSHPSKLNEIEQANELGYKTYLYFICTDSPEINKSRVGNRVEKGGHSVDNSKIESRYLDSLSNLQQAIRLVHRAYLFDNSGKSYKLIAEVFEGKTFNFQSNTLPYWFMKYVAQPFQLELPFIS